MQTIEVTGKSVVEASEEAAKQLGAEVAALKITVLEQTKGLFGKGTVRILAELEGKAAVREEEPEKAPPKPKAARGRKAAEKSDEEEKPVEITPEEETAAPAAVGADAPPDVVASTEDGDRIMQIVNDVLGQAAFKVEAKVVSLTGRYVNVELDGDGKELGYLVGKNGEVLNALQYLLNIMSTHKMRNGVRLTLDANNYRRRRESALSKYAEQIATEVRSRREEAVLDPLPAFERRIIHKALSEMDGVTTYSEGEEPNRRVVIAPAE